eukprot:1736008-Pyramimonas_sp.AAC.1
MRRMGIWGYPEKGEKMKRMRRMVTILHVCFHVCLFRALPRGITPRCADLDPGPIGQKTWAEEAGG